MDIYDFVELMPPCVKTVNLSCNNLTSFAGCERLPRGIKVLYMEVNEIKTFKGCVGLPDGLKELYLRFNRLESFEGCERLPRGLKKLCIQQDDVMSMNGCVGLPRGLAILDQSHIVPEDTVPLLRYTQFGRDHNLLTCIKFLQRHYYDIEPILCQIRGSPYLDNTKTLLEEQGRLFTEDPDALLRIIESV